MSRVSIESKDGGKLLKIKAFRDEGKQKTFLIWVIAWSICGIAIGSQLFVKQEDQLKTLLLVFVCFWAYFEYKVLKTYRWRNGGEEQIWIGEEEVKYGRTIKNRGFLKPYRKEFINPIRKYEEESKMVSSFTDSYWVVGGETLVFTCQGKVLPIGLRLSINEQKKVAKFFNENLND